ncbi:MAG: biosynthetic-type acetolactate synthase large subunit [Prevotella sp.]|nr:biosynthetic-type acetolactate synthase large subunit [Prevotella sp.]MCI6558942.1 biosynthetic-type acetolactate synthase large subunit [Prevotella sp.]MDD6978041.1 biosynthetic-type acetolactate synthase large subunit [Prevotellaceae bacterium]MDY4890968.1 biosynthetic-type acetolactate synthase large subunit [Prevotella sp.]MDY6200351.1 biosynthetic-type acetolactate synthase large subunit [Prevotella sp.]
MNKETITGAEALMRALVNEGVTTIFGYPGGSIMPVFDALYDYTRGEKKAFNHILVRHEQAAAHAAEGYARVSGNVGVCLVTSGPGATNTLTGVADAMMDSTPMVVIAGQVGVGVLGTDAFQEVDLVGVAQPISKWSYQIRRPEDVAWAVSRAFYIARSGRPGPVVLDFPKNAQVHTTEWQPKHVDFVRSYMPYPKLNLEAVAKAADIINNAKKPLALVGQGVELGNAQNELVDFLEKADIPAARTLLGLSALPSNHPLNMGMLGMHGNYAPNVKEQECDVIIAIGMRFSDRVTGLQSTYAKQAKIIHLDIDHSEIDKCIKTDVAVIADCKESLPAITKLLNKAEHREWRDSFAKYDEMERKQVIEPAIHPTEGPLLMGEVVNAVAEATKGEAVLVTDVGQNQMFSSRYFKYHRNRSIVTSGGLGTMGYGIPAAIGATFGAPERTVCMFCGDGGFQMSIQELGTIMEQQAPVKMILLNNNYLGNVRQWQDMFFNRRKSFTKMLNPCYEQVAAAYGIEYQAVTEREQLQDAIKRMLNTDGPFIMECAIKEDDNVLPMTPPGKSVDEMLLEI